MTGWRERDGPGGDHESAAFDEALAAVLEVVGELVTVLVRDEQRRVYVTKYGRLARSRSDDDPRFRIGDFFYLTLPRDSFSKATWSSCDYGTIWGVTLHFGALRIQIGDNLNRIGD